MSDVRPRSPVQMCGKSPVCGSSLVPDKCALTSAQEKQNEMVGPHVLIPTLRTNNTKPYLIQHI